MIDTGFPERALSLLEGPAEREAAAERRYLRAEAAIESGNHAAAIDDLMGMSDSRARALRARAYAGLGEHRAALEAVDPMSLEPGQETLQFRAGAWERLTLEEDEILSGFAEAVLAPGVTSPAETLEDRRAILAQSQESRRAIEGLLQRFDGGSSQD
jgi:Tfp pilus assembly protein PilF